MTTQAAAATKNETPAPTPAATPVAANTNTAAPAPAPAAAPPAPPATTAIATVAPEARRPNTDDHRLTTTLNPFGSAGNFEAAQRMAKALSESSMVPKTYQGSVSNCLLAIEMASRSGSGVLAVIQNLDIINGKPGFSSKYLIGTVNASGRFKPLRFRWQGKQGDMDWGCRAVSRDKDGEECLGTLITWQMALLEGWVERSGSKWKTMPEQMLMYRAAAFWVRVYAPELSLGMMSSEELDDIGPAPIDITPGSPLAPIPGSDQANSGRRMSLGGDQVRPSAPLPTVATVTVVDAETVPSKAEPKTDETGQTSLA